MAGSGRAGRPPLPPAGVPEPKALALGFEDVAAVREAVEGGSSEPFAAEYLGPLLERQVRGDDQTLPLIGRTEDVKKQLGPYLPGRNIAQFVKNDEVELLDLLAEPQELLLLLGLHEQRDQFGHPKESHLSPLATGRERSPDASCRHHLSR